MARLERRAPLSVRRKDGLLRFAANASSQCGEDGILERLFGALLPHPGPRWVVEVGAWDGRHNSNSFGLLNPGADGGLDPAVGRWRGALLEADPARAAEARDLYGDRPDVTVIEAMVGFEGDSSLAALLAAHSPELPLDAVGGWGVLSIDVDGCDYHVWEAALAAQLRPAIVICEFNPTIPNHVLYVQARDSEVRQGSSLLALCELASAHGYRLIETTLYNGIFVCDELWDTVAPHLPDEGRACSIDELHAPQMTTDLWQLYDGSIEIAGCKKMLWHGRRMDIDKMQVIPRSEQGPFPFAPPAPGSPSMTKKPVGCKKGPRRNK